jgi:hypothetical protein
MLRSRYIAFSAVLFLCSARTAVPQTGPCAEPVPGNPLPDLVIDANTLKADLIVTTEWFGSTPCSVIEGCVSSAGKHELLRFSVSTANVGQGDLVIGDPNQCANLFHLSECHGHLHFKEYSDYRLWTEAGYQRWVTLREPGAPTTSPQNAWLLSSAIESRDLLVSRKQGFCMIDVTRYLPDAPPRKKYTLCGGPGASGNQGLQVGWADVYGQELDCQYIEIDSLGKGRYLLEIQVNPEHLLPEADYSNNSTAIVVQFTPRRGKKPGQVVVVD